MAKRKRLKKNGRNDGREPQGRELHRTAGDNEGTQLAHVEIIKHGPKPDLGAFVECGEQDRCSGQILCRRSRWRGSSLRKISSNDSEVVAWILRCDYL